MGSHAKKHPFSGASFLFFDNCGAAADPEQRSFPQRCVESRLRRRIGNAAARGCGGAVKPLNRIPILCTVSILYLFIIGRNLSTKQTLAAARHAGSGECGQMTTWNAIRIKPWHPFSGPCWRCTYLPVLTLGMQCHLCCQTGIKQKRESASLVRAVKGGPQGNPTPG